MSDAPQDDSSEPQGSVLDERPDRLRSPDDADDGLNWYLVLGVLATAGLIGYLVIDGLGSQTYFFEVHEAVAQADSLTNERIRVKGKVVDGTIEEHAGEVGKTFDIAAKGETMTVSYDRAAPDTFKTGVKVVATGTLKPSKTLHADKLLVKCPSRYEGKPPTAGEGEGPRAER